MVATEDIKKVSASDNSNNGKNKYVTLGISKKLKYFI